MVIIKIFLSLLLPSYLGFVTISTLMRRQTLPLGLQMGLSFGLGLGLLSLWMLLLGMVHLKINYMTITIPLVLISALLFVRYRSQNKQNSEPLERILSLRTSKDQHNLTPTQETLKFILWTVLIIFILQNIYYIFWRALNIPINTYDALATIAFKGKIFYYLEHLPPLPYLPHKTYPLLTPFSEAWVAFNLGFWSDTLVKIIFPITLICLLTVFYSFISFVANRTWAFLGCAMLLSSNLFNFHATISYRDFMLTYYNCITVILLLYWSKTRSNGLLILASLFAGITTFTKLEGTPFLLIYTILFSLINFTQSAIEKKDKWINFFKFTVPSYSVCIIFHIFKVINKATKDGSGTDSKTRIDFTLEQIDRVPTIIKSFLENIYLSGNWGIVWFILTVSMIHYYRNRKNIMLNITLLSFVLYFGLYFTMGLFTVNFHWIAGAAKVTTESRLILHFFPLTVLAIAMLNYQKPPEVVQQKNNPQKSNTFKNKKKKNRRR